MKFKVTVQRKGVKRKVWVEAENHIKAADGVRMRGWSVVAVEHVNEEGE